MSHRRSQGGVTEQQGWWMIFLLVTIIVLGLNSWEIPAPEISEDRDSVDQQTVALVGRIFILTITALLLWVSWAMWLIGTARWSLEERTSGLLPVLATALVGVPGYTAFWAVGIGQPQLLAAAAFISAILALVYAVVTAFVYAQEVPSYLDRKRGAALIKRSEEEERT